MHPARKGLAVGLIALLLAGCRPLSGRAASPGGNVKPTTHLKILTVFYGWPSQVNQAGGELAAALAALSGSEVVVFGWGLQRADHGDHQPATRIIAALVGQGVEVYGYVPLGPSVGLSLEAVGVAVERWRAAGVSGIFFDEAGFDFNNTRARQNHAFELAHRGGLRVFANAWNPDDLFGGAPATALGRGDCYLYESFGLVLGEPEEERARATKLARLAAARRLGVRVFGVTTSAAGTPFEPSRWRQLQGLARRAGLEGLGWGGHLFGAQDGQIIAPARLRGPQR